ncbi:MAG: YraN family protein [Sporomusaceae bacterium]|nr:YraN family protein [Sporomusaceae bacterium]
MNKLAVGDFGERAAAGYLEEAGYEILKRKYRLKIGEIDIIAKLNNTLVFVEVKTRSSSRYGFPAEAVTYRKQQKIVNTALCYLNYINKPTACCRFDVIEVFLTELRVIKYNHIIDAFSK